MQANRHAFASAACIFALLALPAVAADRVRAGQWDTTVNVAGETITGATCMSQGDADAMNGDAASVRSFVEKHGVSRQCKVSEVKVNGGQVVVTSICAGAENVGTTTYHGDSYESVNTNGVKGKAKWIGACK